MRQGVGAGKSLKERVRAGEVVIGTHTYAASPAIVEIIGNSGFDWVLIDCEHSPVGPYDTLVLEGLLRAADLTGVTAVVRVPANDEIMIMKVLDSGATGIVVPHVVDADSARRAVRAARYPPDGVRGAASNIRSTGYYSRLKSEGADFWKKANERVLTVLLIEDAKAIENAREIVEVPGVDVLYVGFRDLAMSMGESDPESPRVRETVGEFVALAKARGIALGASFYYPNLESARGLVERGFTWLTCTSDVRIFAEACSAITSDLARIVR